MVKQISAYVHVVRGFGLETTPSALRFPLDILFYILEDGCLPGF
jgi:hypothetical protein